MDIDKSLNQAPLGMSPMMTEMDEGPDIEIEIEDPESVNIGIDGMEIEIDPSEDEGDFNDNLAEDLDEGVLTELAGDLIGEFEEDIDTEAVNLTNRYEKKVKEEKEEAAKLKGENGIMRKKFNTLNKDIEENKSEIARMADNEKKLQNVILGFERDIQNLRKEVKYILTEK